MDKIILSQDGSNTVISEKFGVSYHSKYGAIQETNTVFLDAGLQYAIDNQDTEVIKVFEMGFGTGLNALMTFLKSNNKNWKIDYHTVEAYPIAISVASALNFKEVLDFEDDIQELFLKMHAVSSGETIQLTDNFSFTKYINTLQELDLHPSYFDVIYYDAFAPSSQEELWTPEIMSKCYDATQEGGTLVSYCAKGSYKRALKSAGYMIEGLPGPIGKREMTRAIKAAT